MKTQVAKISQDSPRISTTGTWIARDGKKWVVNVPTSGGGRIFEFDDYGGHTPAYQVARKFHDKKEKQYRKDLEYFHKNGERIIRVSCANNTGVTGVMRKVYPVLQGPPNIVYNATYTNTYKGIFESKQFSIRKYISIEKAFEEAKKQRKQWEKQYGK